MFKKRKEEMVEAKRIEGIELVEYTAEELKRCRSRVASRKIVSKTTVDPK